MESKTSQDYIIGHVDYALSIFKKNTPVKWTFNDIAFHDEEIAYQDDQFKKKIYRKITDFMLQQQYIIIGGNPDYITLTPEGIKAKDLGGHQKYKFWKRKKKYWKIIKEIAFWLLFAGGIMAGIDVGIKWLSMKEDTSIISPSDTIKPIQNQQTLTPTLKVKSDSTADTRKNHDSLQKE